MADSLDDLANFFGEAIGDFSKQALPKPPSEHAVKTIRVLLSGDVQENFTGAHDPEGQPWLPLKRPRRRKRDKRKAQGGRRPNNAIDLPLQDTGALKASAAYSAGNVEVVPIAGGLEIAFDEGLLQPYGPVHQHGTRTNSKRKIPARPFLGVSEDAAESIADIVAEDQANQVLQ